MNTQGSYRPLISQGVIALAVCAGAYFMFVEPLERELGSVREQVSAAQQRTADASNHTLSIASLQQMQRQSAQHVQEMRSRNAIAADEATLFESIMRLAGAVGVRVESMNPAARASDAPKLAPGAPAAADRRTAYSLTVHCSYDQLTRFVERLQADLGYTFVKAIRLSPSPDSPDAVTAAIETEHFYFDLSSLKSITNAEIRP